MVHFFYNLEYADTKEKASVPKEDSHDIDTVMAEAKDVKSPDCPLYMNALAYGIADKYGVLDMKAYALEKTTELLKPRYEALRFKWLDFFRAVSVVWATTPDSDKGLRKMYLAIALTKRSEILENEDAFQQLYDAEEFLKDLLLEDWKISFSKDRSLSMVRVFQCNDCSSKVSEPKCRRCRSAKMVPKYVPEPKHDWVSETQDLASCVYMLMTEIAL